jgi:hypothetical protein
MPLIDLNTNLKSLTYGEFGSTEPLVIKDINTNPSISGIELEGSKRVDDLKRISKLLTQTPAASKFASNQAALGLIEKGIQNPDASFGKKLLGGVVGTATKLASTLAQVPVSGTGLHFVEGFAGKRGYIPGVRGHVEYKNKVQNSLYDDGKNQISLKNKLEDSEDNTKRGKILTTYVDKFVDHGPGGSKERELFALSTQNPVGRYDQDQLNKNKKGPAYKLLYLDPARANPKDLEQSGLGFNRFNDDGNKKGQSSKYKVNITSKLLRDKDSKDLNIKVVDAISGQGPIIGNLSDSKTILDETGKEYKDLIDFNFKVITPRKGQEDDSEVTYLPFRAYLTSFGDNFVGNWNSHNYIGRAESFHSYSGFERTISVAFKVAANSKEEILPLYQKLNLLAGATAPTYVDGGFMRGQIVSLTVGDYLSDTTGIITSVDFSWSTDYIWHTNGMDQKNASEQNPSEQRADATKKLPSVLDVTVSFTPIHQHIPKYGSEFIGRENILFKSES